LEKADYGLMTAIQAAQRSFCITDPSLPDNPIIFASKGFCELSGYQLEEILGRNCRFLQGPGTDMANVELLRKGVREGTDTSICLLNYKADGTPFYNQIFVAALRDANSKIINYVGVQVEVRFWFKILVKNVGGRSIYMYE
jgi:PAS domain S-box-containing protein